MESYATPFLFSIVVFLELVVELADVRVIALGVLNKPRGTSSVNENARLFLHPPGIEKDNPEGPQEHLALPTGLGTGEGGSDSVQTRAGVCS